MPSETPLHERRVLLVAPTQRDAEVTRDLLEKAQVPCVICAGLLQLKHELTGGVGAIMLTEHALFDPHLGAVLNVLETQAPWSDVPVVLLTRVHPTNSPASRVLGRFRNLTVLDRPTSTRSMVSTVHAALRARERQYQLRAQLQAQTAAELALREADKRKDEFLATLAHELRNPLAPLRTGLELLRDAGLDEARLTRVHQMMDRQVTQLVKLIDDLLEVARIATGKVALKRERIDIRSAVEAAVESSQPSVLSAQHRLRVSVPSAPVWVEADVSRLEQVICNLLNNACKYTPRGGELAVMLTHDERRAIIKVIDNGMGIPADMLPLVFDMFTQIDRSLDRAEGGLGIGLSLVRRLMELHGGEVRAESGGANRGSTFTLLLPLANDAAASAQDSSLPATAPTRARRILVVDDNRDAADALSMLLTTRGHDTRIAYDGAAGIELAAEFHPDVVFCDLGMPGASGFDVARQLRSDGGAAVTLVALTGWGAAEDRRRTRAGGFDAHVTKPITLADVERILAQLP